MHKRFQTSMPINQHNGITVFVYLYQPPVIKNHTQTLELEGCFMSCYMLCDTVLQQFCIFSLKTTLTSERLEFYHIVATWHSE